MMAIDLIKQAQRNVLGAAQHHCAPSPPAAVQFDAQLSVSEGHMQLCYLLHCTHTICLWLKVGFDEV